MTVSKPKIDSIGHEVYLLHWEKEKIKMQVDHIYESTKDVSGEIVVFLNSDTERILKHSRINFLSDSAKSKMASELSHRLDLDWQAMIEQATINVLKEYRRGEPVQLLGDEVNKTFRFRIKPFVIDNQLNALYAYGGEGKSTLSMLMAIIAQNGLSILGMQSQQGNSLVLDWEATFDDMTEIANAIIKGLDLPSCQKPFYRKCHRIVAQEIQEIQKQVLDKNIAFVIVDSAGMAAGFDNDYHNSALNMVRALRSLGITVLIIDHKPKEGNSMFGSVYKTNECRSAWELKGTRDEISLNVALIHTKHNLTKKFSPISYHIGFYGDDEHTDSIVFTEQDIKSVSDFREYVSLKDRAREALGRNPMRLNELAEETFSDEKSLKTVLYRNKSLFKRWDDGKWSLLYSEE